VDRTRIEGEIRRLAPWYYEFDLDGVSTTITPPCDHHGHRKVRLPNVARTILVGSTVLDAACNEGGYSFCALDFGAKHVTGFDAREVNIEKARLVADVRGDENVAFHVSTADEWIAREPEEVDNVFLCGLLYHLSEPWRTIEEYCRLARNGVFVTSLVAGGETGYTDFVEQEGIASAADPSRVSHMPNDSRTIIREFLKNGFLPMYIAENRTRQPEGFWGGCSLYFRRSVSPEPVRSGDGDGIELHLVPRVEFGDEIDVVVYNWGDDALDLVGELVLEGPGGARPSPAMETPFTLTPRVSERDGSASESMFLPVRLHGDQRTATQAHATVRERGSGRVLAERSVQLTS